MVLTSAEDKVMLGADVGAGKLSSISSLHCHRAPGVIMSAFARSAAAARKDDSFQEEGIKEVAKEKEKHWRDGGEF